MATYKYKTPISEAEIRKLKVRDILYISGNIVTARDQAHKRALEYAQNGKTLPLSLEGLAIFHCGPVMKKQGKKWVAVAAGPTTSSRMETCEDEFIKTFKPSVIVGKGGMGKRTTDAMVKHGSVYCAFTGGAAILAAKAIKRIAMVEWLDLGMPEALWNLEVEQFGPLVVAIDSYGSNLFDEVSKGVKDNRQLIRKKMGL